MSGGQTLKKSWVTPSGRIESTIMTNTPHLLETCLESGPMTQEQMAEALAGQARVPVVMAIISKLEHCINDLRNETETPGADSRLRDEKSGAIHEMKLLRLWLIQSTAQEKLSG